MAVNDPNYRYATETWEADGIQYQYEIAFDGGYISQSDVVAYSVLIAPITEPDGTITYDRRPEVLTFISEAATTAQVEIHPTVPVGRRVIIHRSTDKSSPLVMYTNNSMLTKDNLDLANKQAIFAIAEIMDGLNEQGIALDTTVQQVVDLNQLANTVYNTVLNLLNASGIIGVKPLVWEFVGDGVSTDFPIPAADLPAPEFYDAYVDRLGQEPVKDFTILPASDLNQYSIRFTVPPAMGASGFVILRGSAKPYDGGAPITSLRMPVLTISTAYFVDKAAEFALLRATGAAATTVQIKGIAAGSDPKTTLGTGSYFSVAQRGTGVVTITADAGVTLVIPADCLPATRGVGSTISASCEDADTNSWVLSGDLAKA